MEDAPLSARADKLRRGAGASAVFVRVAASIAEDIRRGALRAGDRLPSTRALAGQLTVNRNTVVAAYDELVAQGWVTARGPGGTFVSEALPERPARRAPAAAPRGIPVRPGFDVRSLPPSRALPGPYSVRYQISLGIPDTRLLPSATISAAYRRALRSRAGRAGLDYGDPRGELGLRTALAQMLRERRGIPATADNILITRGSQMALDVTARLLLRPGDVVCAEQLGYRPAWRSFEETGAQLVAIPLDGHGLVVDALPPAPVRAIHVTPHHQYPTTVLLSPARRLALLERAARERIAILEDDYDHEFHFEGRPVAPLAAADRSGSVIYLGTLSKILAPGLRLGFLAAPERAIASLARISETTMHHGDQILERAIAELLEDGEITRHARKMRRVYQSRRDALAAALTRELPGALRFELPAGGMTLWARVDDAIKLDAWRDRAISRGVAFATARDFALDGRPRPFIRLGFARYDEAELADAVRRMRRALDDR
jgi:GntR family transcriptional regulator/MocR family aminotransferase